MSDEIDDFFEDFLKEDSDETKENSIINENKPESKPETKQEVLQVEPEASENKESEIKETSDNKSEKSSSSDSSFDIDDIFGDTKSEPKPEPKQPEEPTKPDTTVKETKSEDTKTIVNLSGSGESNEVTKTEDEIVITPKPKDIDILPDRGLPKVVVTVYSHKGHGKTDTALSFPGSIAAISFDYKTKPVAQKRYSERHLDLSDIKSVEDVIKKAKSTKDWIIVWDGKRYYDESSPEAKLSSAEVTFEYLIKVFELIKILQPDWVLIDGTEIMHEICEMLMRYRNGLAPFQGVSNRNLWKERRMYMRQIHKLAMDSAKRGVIYTLYPEGREIKIVDGEVVDRDEIPKWIDIVLYETDIVIKCEQRWTEGIRKWFVRVESNKSPIIRLKEGVDIDVTDKRPFECIIEK